MDFCLHSARAINGSGFLGGGLLRYHTLFSWRRSTPPITLSFLGGGLLCVSHSLFTQVCLVLCPDLPPSSCEKKGSGVTSPNPRASFRNMKLGLPRCICIYVVMLWHKVVSTRYNISQSVTTAPPHLLPICYAIFWQHEDTHLSSSVLDDLDAMVNYCNVSVPEDLLQAYSTRH